MTRREIAAPRVVLDTNVVLDWLYFRDPRCAALDRALAGAQLRWIATTAMRTELEQVLARGTIRGDWPGDVASTLRGWDRWVHAAEPAPAAPSHGLRCADADDQKFLDLAIGQRAALLFSRDRALLELARPASLQGLAILAPADWPGLASDRSGAPA